MFDNKVDIFKAYGLKPVYKYDKPSDGEARVTKIVEPTTLLKRHKRQHKIKLPIDAGKTWREYQELRQTKEFKQWWWEQHDKQYGLCYYCLINLDFVQINVEHMKPMSKGGTNNYNNLVLSCQECNKEKNTRLLSKNERKQLKLRMVEVGEKIEEVRMYLSIFPTIELQVEVERRQRLKR
jgi:5-methylcytosine-specific restriction endonuclease McrA